MTKLNDKDRQFIKESTIHMEGGSYVFLDDVEELLIQKQTEINELKSRICDLECCLNEIVTENCCRDPESIEGFPLSPDHQDDILIADAMKLLSKG